MNFLRATPHSKKLGFRLPHDRNPQVPGSGVRRDQFNVIFAHFRLHEILSQRSSDWLNLHLLR